MPSVLLLLLVGCILAVPGIAASFAAFPPGEISVVTRSAAAFGLGYAVSGGWAYILSSAHLFKLGIFIAVWLASSAVLWWLAIRRGPLRAQAHAIAQNVREHRLPLLLGILVVAATLITHFGYIYILGGPRYVYYLNGIEIANSGGVPSATLEYGQLWPPATDKIFLDAFTGMVYLFNHNVVIGPGVLLWISMLGAALGLWATAWELGLRYTAGLLPLVLLGNQVIINTRLSRGFTQYRAEDFGEAVAYCALALGIVAIRKRQWARAVIAGIVLGAASGSHLVPVVAVSIALVFVGLAEILRGKDLRARLIALRQGAVIAGVLGVLLAAIRVFAGGSFGLQGASNPATYAAIHTSFDPTAYLYDGRFLPRVSAQSGHWYVPPGQVLHRVFAYSGLHVPGATGPLVILAGMLAVTVLLFLLVPTDLRTVGIVGLGLVLGVIAVAMYFAYRYHVYIDATFGVRRMSAYAALGMSLLYLGIIEAILLRLSRIPAPALFAAATVPVVLVSAWLLPGSGPSRHAVRVGEDRVHLITWIRTHTPCNAEFVVDQRTEGTLTSLTGRAALTEGMGPFLRVDRLPYVVNLMLSTRHFYLYPTSDEAFLRQHHISYVIAARVGELLGYGGPIHRGNIPALNAAPFLRPVLVKPYVVVYKVVGSKPPPLSPLLKGPYLHCLTAPAHF